MVGQHRSTIPRQPQCTGSLTLRRRGIFLLVSRGEACDAELSGEAEVEPGYKQTHVSELQQFHRYLSPKVNQGKDHRLSWQSRQWAK